MKCCVSSFGSDDTIAVGDGNIDESVVWVESISRLSVRTIIHYWFREAINFWLGRKITELHGA